MPGSLGIANVRGMTIAIDFHAEDVNISPSNVHDSLQRRRQSRLFFRPMHRLNVPPIEGLSPRGSRPTSAETIPKLFRQILMDETSHWMVANQVSYGHVICEPSLEMR